MPYNGPNNFFSSSSLPYRPSTPGKWSADQLNGQAAQAQAQTPLPTTLAPPTSIMQHTNGAQSALASGPQYGAQSVSIQGLANIASVIHTYSLLPLIGSSAAAPHPLVPSSSHQTQYHNQPHFPQANSLVDPKIQQVKQRHMDLNRTVEDLLRFTNGDLRTAVLAVQQIMERNAAQAVATEAVAQLLSPSNDEISDVTEATFLFQQALLTGESSERRLYEIARECVDVANNNTQASNNIDAFKADIRRTSREYVKLQSNHRAAFSYEGRSGVFTSMNRMFGKPHEVIVHGGEGTSFGMAGNFPYPIPALWSARLATQELDRNRKVLNEEMQLNTSLLPPPYTLTRWANNDPSQGDLGKGEESEVHIKMEEDIGPGPIPEPASSFRRRRSIAPLRQRAQRSNGPQGTDDQRRATPQGKLTTEKPATALGFSFGAPPPVPAEPVASVLGKRRHNPEPLFVEDEDVEKEFGVPIAKRYKMYMQRYPTGLLPGKCFLGCCQGQICKNGGTWRE